MTGNGPSDTAATRAGYAAARRRGAPAGGGAPVRGGAPEDVFNLSAKEVSAREYCNLHSLWKS